MNTRKIYADTLNKIHRKLLSNGKKYDSVDPSDTAKDGIYSISQGGSWTESFYTGMLWLDYLITKNEAIKKNIDMQMWEFRQRLRQVRNLNHHDIGFLYSLSAVAGYTLTSEEIYKDTLLTAARLLAERYCPQGKFIQAWGDIHDRNAHRLIIDCMLNIPLLYRAAEVTGDENFIRLHIITPLRLWRIFSVPIIPHIIRSFSIMIPASRFTARPLRVPAMTVHGLGDRLGQFTALP